MKYGLCCLFYNEPIKFRTYRYSHIFKLPLEDARTKIFGVWDNNIDSLQKSFNYCKEHNIQGYRIGSDIFPQLSRIQREGFINSEDIKNYQTKLSQLNSYDLILSMHPGQYVNLGSPRKEVIEKSVENLKDHFIVAYPLKCKEINIHVGGTYGEKEKAETRFVENIKSLLSEKELKLITIENDEYSFDIHDCIRIANELNIRVTYDVHHQRCYETEIISDEKELEYFNLAKETWKNYKYQRIHLSSPKEGWGDDSFIRSHHDYINIDDVPLWLCNQENVYVDIEAKAKEKAIKLLKEQIKKGVN